MSINKLTTNASLKQVMDKFEEISLKDFFNIDVIIRSELPKEVKDGQVVIISSISGKVYICKERPSNLSDGDVFIEIDLANSFVNMPMLSKATNIEIPLHKAIQVVGGTDVKVECYVGVDGAWKLTTKKEFYIFEPGVGIYKPLSTFTTTSCTVSISTSMITFNATGSNESGAYRIATSKEKIDLTDYSKAEIEAQGDYTTLLVKFGNKEISFTDRAVKIMDLSDITGLQSLSFAISSYGVKYGYVYSIKLIA